jgi:phosphohistidine phosphatase
MCKITIMRHGKAQRRDPANIADRERVLKERGRKDARRVGAFFADMVPDLILSSPAKRALETATLFAEGAGYDHEIKVEERIYTSSTAGLINVLREQEGEHLLLVGHNPPLSSLVDLLDGEENRAIVDGAYLVTAATAHIVFKGLDDWSDLQENSGQLRALISPRFLKDL